MSKKSKSYSEYFAKDYDARSFHFLSDELYEKVEKCLNEIYNCKIVHKDLGLTGLVLNEQPNVKEEDTIVVFDVYRNRTVEPNFSNLSTGKRNCLIVKLYECSADENGKFNKVRKNILLEIKNNFIGEMVSFDFCDVSDLRLEFCKIYLSTVIDKGMDAAKLHIEQDRVKTYPKNPAICSDYIKEILAQQYNIDVACVKDSLVDARNRYNQDKQVVYEVLASDFKLKNQINNDLNKQNENEKTEKEASIFPAKYSVCFKSWLVDRKTNKTSSKQQFLMQLTINNDGCQNMFFNCNELKNYTVATSLCLSDRGFQKVYKQCRMLKQQNQQEKKNNLKQIEQKEELKKISNLLINKNIEPSICDEEFAK